MKWLTARRAIAALLLLVLLVGAGNLWASYSEVQTFKQQLGAQQRAEQKTGAAELSALCTDLGTMARIPPPAGNPAANPSRSYEQAESRAWHGLFTGLRCR